MLIRAEAGEDVKELGEWWTKFQEVNQGERDQMVRELGTTGKKKKSKKPIPQNDEQ